MFKLLVEKVIPYKKGNEEEKKMYAVNHKPILY